MAKSALTWEQVRDWLDEQHGSKPKPKAPKKRKWHGVMPPKDPKTGSKGQADD